MNDIVIIIPVHTLDGDVPGLLKKAVSSVPEGLEIRISCKHGLSGKLKEMFKDMKSVVLYENENKESAYDFQTLVNQAVGDSKWFSILEFDDEYTDIWLSNVKRYLDYQKDVSVILPFEDLFDFESGEYLGYGNDAPWAASFSDEIGFVDMDSLKTYFDFYLTGGLFNTKDWQEIGGLKKSMKVTFWYEFMMRCIHYGKKIFVMPKVGYKHYLGRKESLLESYKDTVSEKEGQGYFELARQEYFFKEDRNKVWKPEEDEE